LAFLQWLLTELIALFKFYWSKRAKAYVRISLALIVGGIAILSASPVVLALQLLKIIIAPTSADNPWWMDPATKEHEESNTQKNDRTSNRGRIPIV